MHVTSINATPPLIIPFSEITASIIHLSMQGYWILFWILYYVRALLPRFKRTDTDVARWWRLSSASLHKEENANLSATSWTCPVVYVELSSVLISRRVRRKGWLFFFFLSSPPFTPFLHRQPYGRTFLRPFSFKLAAAFSSRSPKPHVLPPRNLISEKEKKKTKTGRKE